ncbi:Nose resistant to fluoxetine protein 6 like protein [Argiope bruennichi]|uniref:Nose resistant to fluoxetine protein 6 like protein n=1 Tax=Argiope bruennichi TaxID=94029 RepID=A0A8T0FA67_ARGBR|nr:Nose resistant to fluoxetine protein 6 like protein [Argiope bruennichi]
MVRQTCLIVIFLFSLELTQAARVLKPLSFGIIGENSEENFPEVEKFELNNARQFTENSHAHIFSISSSVNTATETVSNEKTTAKIKEVATAINGNGTNVTTINNEMPVETAKLTTEKNFHQDFKTVKPEVLQKPNDNEKFNKDGISTVKIDESSFTEVANDNSVPKLTTITEVKNVNDSTVTSVINRATKPTKITRKVDFASESVRKNVIRALPSKNAIPEKNSSKIESIEDQWLDLEKTFRIYTDSVMKKALPKFLRIHSQLNISSQCNAALLQMVSGLRNFKSWAVKMVDSSGRLPSGTFEGTLTDLGDYDQCLDIVQPTRGKHMNIQGQYCTLEVAPVLPSVRSSATMNTKLLNFGNISTDSVLTDISHGSALFHLMMMRIGICVPSPCVADDLQALAAALLKKVPVQVSVRNCETKQPFHLTIPQFIVISIAVVIAILICAGTAVDSYMSRNAARNQDMGRVPQSLLAFSLTTNLKQLMKSSRRNSTLGAVNGVRCLSLLWIILAHTYGFGHRQGLARLSHAKTYMDDIFFQIITNSWVSVDTFFLLGGLLVATSTLKIIESTGGKISFISRLLHRIWRLIPPLAATVGFTLVLPLIGSGPLWADMAGKKVHNCEQRWWQVFLPINTWVDFNTMCLLHTWYVASDVHFYCLALLALCVLYRWQVAGFVLLFLVTVRVFGPLLLTVIYNLPPTVIFFSPDIELTKKTANLVYFRPYPHIGAYCVGLLLGYLLWKHHKWTLTKMTQTVGWAMSATSCLAVLFATYSWSRGNAADPVEGVVYAVLHRTAWAAGVAWVLFICAIGQGGNLNKFLSWQLFTPLSRLCYFIYLLHFPILWIRISWRRTLLPFHHYDLITEFSGILIITLVLSLVFHLAFEAPFLKLEQIWCPERAKPNEVKKPLEDAHAT